MTDLLIPDIDGAVLLRLQSLADLAGMTVVDLVARMFRAEAHGPDGDGPTRALVQELAAMRASQSLQDGDATVDVRDLRDGVPGEPSAGRVA